MRILFIIALGIIFFFVLQSLWRESKRSFREAIKRETPKLGCACFSAPFLELGIDWHTSVFKGTLLCPLSGVSQGQSLNALSQEKILALYEGLKKRSCAKSCELLRVYFVHRFAHSPVRHALSQERPLEKFAATSERLTVKEAHHILGVPQGSDGVTVRSAHRQLTKKLHPDRPEGSVYLTTQLNLARDLLLRICH